MIPANALPIIEARKKGLKPADLILVSLIGRLNEKNHTVYAAPGRDYDWRWCRDIAVIVFAAPGVIWRPCVASIAACLPSYLGIWDADRREGAQVWRLPRVDDIEKPKGQWRWELDFLPWLPFQNQEFAWS